jgi:hypothetical protein
LDIASVIVEICLPFNKSWREYDDSLIECGCILIDIGFIKSWKKEIDILAIAKRSKNWIRTWCHERTVSFPYFAHTYPVKYV